MTKTDLFVPALDGYPLPATLFTREHPRSAIIVSPATATPRGFYRAFCQHLASLGAAVLVYDYRGTFEPVAQLRASQALMREWGTLDFPGVVDFMRARYPNLPLDAVGHSVGGHVLMMTSRAAAIRSAVLVASQSGYWRLYRGFERQRVYAFVKVVMPVLTRIFGYFPGKRLIFGTDLAPGILYEWSRWCTSPQYFFHDPSMEQTLSNGGAFRGNLLMIGIADDPWATPQAIGALLPGFSAASIARLELDPRAYQLSAVGHMGFFRAASSALWSVAADALQLHRATDEKSA